MTQPHSLQRYELTWGILGRIGWGREQRGFIAIIWCVLINCVFFFPCLLLHSPFCWAMSFIFSIACWLPLFSLRVACSPTPSHFLSENPSFSKPLPVSSPVQFQHPCSYGTCCYWSGRLQQTLTHLTQNLGSLEGAWGVSVTSGGWEGDQSVGQSQQA